MKVVWKSLWLALASVLVLLGTGCAGINASHSVSPASFFLPGLLQTPPRHTATNIAQLSSIQSSDKTIAQIH